jgi:hypothetical protein
MANRQHSVVGSYRAATAREQCFLTRRFFSVSLSAVRFYAE